MRPNNPVTIGPYQCGAGKDLLLIGVCVLQPETSLELRFN